MCQLEAMTIELLPGRGAQLPWASPPLRFGMTLSDVRGIVQPYADLRDTFVCGATWATSLALADLQVVLFGGETDALTGVSASHRPGTGTTHVPVGLDDIDLFGWPVHEVIDALRGDGREVRVIRHNAWVDGSLHLTSATPPSPRAGFLDDLCLYATPPRPPQSG
jgi:hypothetical protein